MNSFQSNKFLSTKKVLSGKFSAEQAIDTAPASGAAGIAITAIESIIGIKKFNDIMMELGPPWPDADQIIDYLFEELNIKWTIDNPSALEELSDGPKVFVANHPYGLPDALGMFRLLTHHRPRMKLFANTILAATQLNDDRLLFVDPFMAENNRGLNRKSVATALRHLRSGGDLALFPGRICSHLKTSDWTISDSAWTDQVHRFVEISGGEMVPMHISGRNSMLFNLSGLIHPKLRTYMLLREFLRGGHDFRFRIGQPVSAPQLAQIAKAISPGQFSRSLTYALKTDMPKKSDPILNGGETALAKPGFRLAGNTENLVKGAQHLVTQKNFSVYNVDKDISPELLKTICDVRFAAFSKETKLNNADEMQDQYDKINSHLILWDNDKNQMVGVYRYMLPKFTSAAEAEEKLVSSSIFNLSPQFLKILPRSMELGRAAIMPEYQRHYTPLLLLWRGILEVARLNKEIKYLFGPVTMGQTFTPISRELLHRFIMDKCLQEGMINFVTPKRQISLDIPREVAVDDMVKACHNFADVANFINGFEGGKRSLPVLFRHYKNIGCNYLGFAEWPELDNAAVGLTMLDLKNIRPAFLNRNFGQEGSREFMLGR
ncbi:MAG: lysophospholipid acyltransferase family protein [Rhizobiaceae bacterium]